ncbi:MAG: hypothetical protein V1709_00585 [Planctomycetota bacterium]
MNLETRKTGKNEEIWDGKDESGMIDFAEFGKIHFCIDTLPRSKKDSVLKVELPQDISQGGIVTIKRKSLSLILDIVDPVAKEWFNNQGIKAMVFLDNQLIKLERAKGLPCTLEFDLRAEQGVKHLLTLNVWAGDHSCVAYKNLLIRIELEKENLPIVKTKGEVKTGKIAFCQRRKGYWQLWTADLGGSHLRQITKTLVDKRYPVFSPDGEKIAFVTNQGELWVINSNGKNGHRIPLSISVYYPRWAINGKKIVFVSYQDIYHGDTELWEVDLESLKLNKIVSRPWLQFDPCYSPDGNSLIFTDGPELYGQEIRRLDLKTKDIVQVTDNGPYDYDMEAAYTPDGQSIVYASNECANYDIWIMDKFGSNKRNLTQNPACDIMPQVTSDGRSIYFLSDRDGSMQVWRMDTEGKERTRITGDKNDKLGLSVYTKCSLIQ